MAKVNKAKTGLKEIQKYIDSPEIFVNVGAYTGSYVIALHRVFPTVKIYSIEADPKNFSILSKKTRKCDEIIPCNFAITDKNEIINMYVCSNKTCEGTSQSNSLFEGFLEDKDWVKKIEEVPVQGITLDQFYSDNKLDKVDYLKLNCEGCEYKIFSGPLGFLQKTKLICLAMHGKSSIFKSEEFVQKRKDIMSTLSDSGFTMVAGKTGMKGKNHVGQIWVRDE